MVVLKFKKREIPNSKPYKYVQVPKLWLLPLNFAGRSGDRQLAFGVVISIDGLLTAR